VMALSASLSAGSEKITAPSAARSRPPSSAMTAGPK